MTGTLQEDQCTFLVIPPSVLPRIRNVSGKSCRKYQKKHFTLKPFFKIRAVYEIMWKNTAERDRPQMTIWRVRIACWVPKATDTLTGCVIFTAFPLQK